MSKRLGGIKGCKYKTSSWHLNRFPDADNIGSCCFTGLPAQRFPLFATADRSAYLHFYDRWECALALLTAMVKPDKAHRVEDMLIHAATSGKLGGKVTEGHFVQMLEQVCEGCFIPYPCPFKVLTALLIIY